MRRRLAPEVRRAEIVEIAKTAITEIGYRSLTMRELARRCGMSAPGMMHYFADLPSLLDAVLETRAETDLSAIQNAFPPDATLADALGAARAYYVERRREIQAFDVLEAESLDPSHPAHEHFRSQAARTIERLRPIIEREFADPDEALRMVRIVLDGIRVERLRAATPSDSDDPASTDSAAEEAIDWATALRLIGLLPRRA